MKAKQNLFIVLALLVIAPTFIWAKPRTKAQMQNNAASAIVMQLASQKGFKVKGQLRELKHTDSYSIFGYAGGGFAIVSADDLAPEILAVSAAQFVSTENPGFNWWIQAINEVISTAVKKNKTLKTITPDPTKYPAEVPTMLTTKWGQEMPYNKFLPVAASGRVLTGCVATAMAQVLKFFEYPLRGIGSHTIYYPYGDTSGSAVEANFGATTYDWTNMINDYKQNYTELQANAVATIMKHCGVASEMHYAGPDEGSGALMANCAEGLRNYFGFPDAEELIRADYSDEQWMDFVFEELAKGHPLIYGGVSPGSMGRDAGHAFVLDGYNSAGLVSVNWGWDGDKDGYYNIDLLNPNMYSFTTNQDLIRGVHGAAKNLVNRTINLPQAGTLADSIPVEMRNRIGELTLTGDINGSDLKLIREMAGRDYVGAYTHGVLSVLNIKEARIVSGGEAYLKDGQLTTSDDNLPERAFYGCNSLRKIVLPDNLKTISDGAFALCRALESVDNITAIGGDNFVYDGGIFFTKDRKEIISVMPFVQGELIVSEGTIALHDYAMAGCMGLKRVVIPRSLSNVGTECMAGCHSLAELKIFAKQPPQLGREPFRYTRTGALRVLVPIDTKTAYTGWANLPAENLREFGSIVIVRNAVREYGEPNPKFGYTIRGDYFEGKPQLSCEATEQSNVGKYDIHISHGTITNQSVELVGGILTVEKATLRVSTDNVSREEGKPNPEFVLHYKGFVNSENEKVLTVRPRVSTTATETSPVGEYELTISGGEAQNYKFRYHHGTLTITSSTGIDRPDEVITNPLTSDVISQTVYSVTGVRVGTTTSLSALPPGIYIVNGRKTIVK